MFKQGDTKTFEKAVLRSTGVPEGQELLIDEKPAVEVVATETRKDGLTMIKTTTGHVYIIKNLSYRFDSPEFMPKVLADG